MLGLVIQELELQLGGAAGAGICAFDTDAADRNASKSVNLLICSRFIVNQKKTAMLNKGFRYGDLQEGFTIWFNLKKEGENKSEVFKEEIEH